MLPSEFSSECRVQEFWAIKHTHRRFACIPHLEQRVGVAVGDLILQAGEARRVVQRIVKVIKAAAVHLLAAIACRMSGSQDI